MLPLVCQSCKLQSTVNLLISGKFFDCVIDILCSVQIFDSVLFAQISYKY